MQLNKMEHTSQNNIFSNNTHFSLAYLENVDIQSPKDTIFTKNNLFQDNL